MIEKLKKIRLYFYTLRYLKFKQIFYQVFYRFKKIIAVRSLKVPAVDVKTQIPTLQPSIASAISYYNDRFIFLNLEKKFDREIDWNFGDHGKLWTYNLNYFDFLQQGELTTQQGLSLIESYCSSFSALKDGLEPYAISLRGINWIKFFSYHKKSNALYDRILYSHYKILASNLEYHLMGNHLLENGFSLLFGAYYFRSDEFYSKAEKILTDELDEQILNDGAHFELSPMYHQILLFRLLDGINLIQSNEWKNDELLALLQKKAEMMLSWLRNITFQNGNVPMVNDTAHKIAPSSEEIFEYADRLKISSTKINLSDSGYRHIELPRMELLVDVGSIGPDYIPGHAHSDTLNFILYADGNPVIVDTGISTYDIGTRRMTERSTQSHNTVTVDGYDQSEVWASFRVGRRARIIELLENEKQISASHDGYKNVGIIHKRSWNWSGSEIVIVDEISGPETTKETAARIHFHPDQTLSLENGTLRVGPLTIKCYDCSKLEIEEYYYAAGFNKLEPAKRLKLHFKNRLKVSIGLQE